MRRKILRINRTFIKYTDDAASKCNYPEATKANFDEIVYDFFWFLCIINKE